VPDALVSVLTGVSAARVGTASSTLIFLFGNRHARRNEHLRHAFDTHLERYERVFVSARTAQDALRNYRVISGKADGRSNPFLFQLLTIAEDAAHSYCVAVTWSHNPGMLYLSKKAEGKCLEARELLHKWLAVRRVYAGDVAAIRTGDTSIPIALTEVRKLRPGDYRELRIETRPLIVKDKDETKRFAEIDRALSAVIAELKEVMAY
jgi:hypothetical protein